MFGIATQLSTKLEETKKKKVFPIHLHKPSLVVMKQNKSHRHEPVKPNIKMFELRGKPSDEIVKHNDKKLLPLEFKNMYPDDKLQRNYSTTNIKKKTNIFSNDDEQSSNSKQKINYPYLKDNMKDVMSYDCPVKGSYSTLTTKINQNAFNILKKVDKFAWQK